MFGQSKKIKQLENNVEYLDEQVGNNPYRYQVGDWIVWGRDERRSAASKMSAFEMIADIHKHLGIRYQSGEEQAKLVVESKKPNKAKKPVAKKKK